jgi:hypothetical protein
LADFSSAIFSSVDFRSTIFEDVADFNNMSSEDGYTLANFDYCIFLKKATFANARFDPSFISASMNDSALRDAELPSENLIRDERDANAEGNGYKKLEKYHNAARTYFFLRTHLHSEGDYKDESVFFYREKLTEKKMLGTRIWLRTNESEVTRIYDLCEDRSWIRCVVEWLWLSLFWITCGFGERVINVIATSMFTWTSFAVAFLVSFSLNPENARQGLVDALYMSLEALSSLGLERQNLIFEPSYVVNWLMQIEAMVGIFLASLFLVIFVRKMTWQ